MSDPLEIVRESEKLIAQIKKQLAETQELYKKYGIDQEQLMANWDDKQKAEAEKMVKKDFEEIDREVSEKCEKLKISGLLEAKINHKRSLNRSVNRV